MSPASGLSAKPRSALTLKLAAWAKAHGYSFDRERRQKISDRLERCAEAVNLAPAVRCYRGFCQRSRLQRVDRGDCVRTITQSHSVRVANLARIAHRRQSHVARECNAKGTCGAVADAVGNVGDVGLVLTQQFFGKRHAPPKQIFHRGDTDGAVEALEEYRPRQRCFFGELCDGPRPPPDVRALRGERSQDARRLNRAEDPTAPTYSRSNAALR